MFNFAARRGSQLVHRPNRRKPNQSTIGVVEALEERTLLSNFTLRIESGGGTTLNVGDNLAGDLDPSVGRITFVGSFDNFTIHASTGVSKPALGGPNEARLDLTSFSSTGGTGSLTISLTDTDYTLAANPANASVSSMIGGTINGGSLTYQTFVDTDNNIFGTAGPNVYTGGLIGPLFPSAYSGSASTTFPMSGDFSITTVAVINVSGSMSFGSQNSVVPVVSPANARISISPSQTNHVGDPHTFVVHVDKDEGSGFVNATDGHVTFNLADSNGAASVLDAATSTCDDAGNNLDASGNCTIVFTSNTPGQVTGHASVDLSVNGSALHRETDGVAPNSGNAVKTYVDAKILIDGDATNEVNTSHTFTVTVLKNSGDGAGFVAAAGETVTASTMAGSVGSITGGTCTTGTTDGNGQCTVIVSSTTAGTTDVHATSTIVVGGVAIPVATVAHDGTSPNDDARKTWVDARIALSPLDATNLVNQAHVITVNVQQYDGVSGPTSAPNGTLVTFSLQNSGGASAAFVGGNTCTTTNGICSVQINSSTPGTVKINATTTFSVAGVSVTRDTDPLTAPGAGPGGTGPANKIYVKPGIDIEKTTNGPSNSNSVMPDYDNEDAANGPGVPILTPGGAVTWTYKVMNTGGVAFARSEVVIVDDNGTPGTSDDLSTTGGQITFVSGDTASDGILSPNEVWIYRATGTVLSASVTGGCYENRGVVTVPGATDNDLSHYCNPPGKITGKKFKDLTGNGLSADDTPWANVTITLYRDSNSNNSLDVGSDAVVGTTTTAADGTYSFNNLPAGTYFAKETVPNNSIRTYPLYQDWQAVSVPGNGQVSNVNFANFQKCDKNAVTSYQYKVNGTTWISDLSGQIHEGDEVQVKFYIGSGYSGVPITLVSYSAPDPYFDANHASSQVVADYATGTFSTGGPYYLTVDVPDSYFQIDFVCGSYINQLGPNGSNIFYTPQGRLIDADNGGVTVPVANPSTLDGNVYLDSDNDGNKDNGESGIGSVTVKLYKVKTSDGTSTLLVTKLTRPDGSYVFSNLPTLASGYTYRVKETQSTTYNDGKDTIGSLGGTTTNDTFSDIVLPGSVHGVNYNFGERPKYLVTGESGAADSGGTGSTVVAGELLVSIEDPEGRLDADQLARIHDAMAKMNESLAQFGVSLVEVGADGTDPNLRLQVATTSACGGVADGALGCTAGSEITIIDGWNWYTGSDASSIGSNQYDYETIVVHELGHGVGLEHTSDLNSPMFPALSMGESRRTLTETDLSRIGSHDTDEEADALLAGSFVAQLGLVDHTSESSARALVQPQIVDLPLCVDKRTIASHRTDDRLHDLLLDSDSILDVRSHLIVNVADESTDYRTGTASNGRETTQSTGHDDPLGLELCVADLLASNDLV